MVYLGENVRVGLFLQPEILQVPVGLLEVEVEVEVAAFSHFWGRSWRRLRCGRGALFQVQ